MRIRFFIASLLLLSSAMFAQDKIYIHKASKLSMEALIANTDSLTFGSDGTTVKFNYKDSAVRYQTVAIDSVSFGSKQNTVFVVYNGASATVTKPESLDSVTITILGADVVIDAQTLKKDINYCLSGTSSDGSFKMLNSKRFNLLLNGLSLTNTDGPAINIQSDNKTTVVLVAGTSSSLSDGSSYATSTENQKATLFSEGQFVFTGSGSLSLKSLAKNAICSDDNISIEDGKITVSSALADGIHAKGLFKMTNGSVSINSTDDGIECETGKISISGGTITTVNASADVKGITCDSSLTVWGGTLNLSVSGNQSKGLKSGQDMLLNGGTIIINASGSAVLSASGSGYDPSYCSAIKSEGNLSINGAVITITSTGKGGKGISSDKNININSGTVNITSSGAGATYTNKSGSADAYTSACLEADGNINIIGGTLVTTSTGVAGKGLTADGNIAIGSLTSSPAVKVTTSGARLTISGSGASAEYADAKAIKSDGTLSITNGTVVVSTSQAGANAIDSDNTLVVAGGTLTVTTAGNGTKAIKASKNISLSGGTINITTTGGVELQASGSGYDPSYCNAIKCSETLTICGSKVTINCTTGAAAKGISANSLIVSSGILSITTSGAGATYTNTSKVTDAYSAACISTDVSTSIIGGTITLYSSGSGGKGISSDGTLTIGNSLSSPALTITTTGAKFTVTSSGSGQSATVDYCHPKAIVCTGAITIDNGTLNIASTDDGIHSEKSIIQNGGTVVIGSSVEGVESLLIKINGGSINVTASNDGFNATAGLVSGGAESDDGSYLYFNGGYVVATATNGDAIDSNGKVEMNGGVVIANGPATGVEEAADFNGTFNMNGGYFIGAGSNSTMIKSMSSTSSQRNLFITSSSLIAAGTLVHIQDASGNDIVTFAPKNGGYKFLFSSSALATGVTYTIFTGGSSTGTETNGLYSGGTYSEGTSKKSFTLSTSSTVTSISF